MVVDILHCLLYRDYRSDIGGLSTAQVRLKMVAKAEIQASESATALIPPLRIHLVGIGGTGMSAIAWVLLGRDFAVSGSDMQLNETTAALAEAGATIFRGHAANHVSGTDLLVISSAVAADNVELIAAREASIPVYKRAEFLGRLMAGSLGVAVAGSHGKTTTTGMIVHILLAAGLDPTFILGGSLPSLGRNGRAGRGRHFVIEADEYDHMFLGLRPQVAVVTNIEHDHPDIFPTAAEYEAAFADFAALLPPEGRLVVCVDDPGSAQLARQVEHRGIAVDSYGLGQGAWQAVDLRLNPMGGSDFVVQNESGMVGLARLRVPGQHNVRNALAAITVTMNLGVDFETIRQALAAFGGIGRRFQIKGEVAGVTVIDDYAHHPTEIRATLAAARQQYPGRRIWAVWQPHTYSRTRTLLAEFAASFEDADRVVALDIYRSREQDDLGIDTAAVVTRMEHPHAYHIGKMPMAAAYIVDRVQPGDVIVTLGAGDGHLVGTWVLEGLQQRLPSERNGAGS
jgi:UDP-N-acetylmuramate--alanine ligase